MPDHPLLLMKEMRQENIALLCVGEHATGPARGMHAF